MAWYNTNGHNCDTVLSTRIRFAADAPAVAVVVTGGGADEGDVHMGFPRGQGTNPTAMAAHDGQTLQLAGGNGFAGIYIYIIWCNNADGEEEEQGGRGETEVAQVVGSSDVILVTTPHEVTNFSV